jgi:hypothetical protein
MDKDERFEAFKRWAPAAAGMICDKLEDPEELIKLYMLATQRHEIGYALYGDRNFEEWDEERFAREFSEEIADALIYGAHLIDLISRRVA